MKLIIIMAAFMQILFANTAFISAQDLQKKLTDKNLVLIDTADIQTYKEGHIPNAKQIDIAAFRKLVDNKYELMRSSKEIEKTARSLGVNNDSYVVIYGHNKPKELLKASYIAMALIVNGFSNISILDGGFDAWKKAAREDNSLISTQTPSPMLGNFTANYNPEILVDMQYVKEKIGKVDMIEARAKKFYDGQAQSPGVQRLGHIKNAQSSNWEEKFSAGEKVVEDKKLKEIFFDTHTLHPKKEVITYCTGGLEASMNWYLLTQHLNFENVKMYDASMKEWGNQEDTPMEKSLNK